MKANLAAICMALIVASCAGDSAQTTTGAPATAITTPKEVSKPKPYPLEICLVSNEDLDEMDERVATVYEGQTFEFCCKPCLVKFRKDPEKYVAKLKAAKGNG